MPPKKIKITVKIAKKNLRDRDIGRFSNLCRILLSINDLGLQKSVLSYIITKGFKKVKEEDMTIKRFFMIMLILMFLVSSLPNNIQASQPKSIDFSFTTYNGQKYKLSNFSGKYILLNLFASYCPPCMVELKVLQRLHETCNNKGLQVISLMIDREGAPLLSRIVSSRNLTYPVGLATDEVFKIFKDFSTTPTTYVINTKGELIDKHVGYQNYNEWIKYLSSFVKCN
ncbi:MAG: TlpA family protein disulfide reductase [Caldimicrobium sp.]